MLNKDQKRGLSIALRIVEENMRDIEQMLNRESYTGILYDMRHSISSEIKEEIFKRVFLVRDKIRVISNGFTLEKEYREVISDILGKLFSSWEIIENVKAKKLKRYGSVSEGLDRILDPHLNTITDLIMQIERLILGTPKEE